MGPMLYYDDENDDYDNTKQKLLYSKHNKLAHEHLENSFYQLNNNNNNNNENSINNTQLKCEKQNQCYSNSFKKLYNKNCSEQCNNIYYNEERHCKMKDSLAFNSSKSINSNILYSTPIDTTITTTTTTATTTTNNLNNYNNNTDIPILSTDDIPLMNIIESDMTELSMNDKDLDNSISLKNENENPSVTSNVSYLSHMPRKLLMKSFSSLFSKTKTDDNDSLQLSTSLSSSSTSTLLSSSTKNLVSSVDSSAEEDSTKNDAMTTNSTSTATATSTTTTATTTIKAPLSSSSSSSSTSTSTSLPSSSSSSASSSLPTIDSSHICDIMNRRRQLRRRRRGRLRKLYDMWNAITSLLLLLIPSSLIIMVNMCIISLSKFYRYMIVFMSNRLISQLLWIIGVAVAVTILPIDLVNATSLFSTSEFDENKDDFDSSYYNNTTINITGTTAATNVTEKKPLFPPDLFTREQLENGAVVFYIMGVIYMFVALAIVCDEFFVPSLDVIIEKLDITDDVAGATFMAAGGSAPELFTSVIGVFVSFDDVGIGTIVGSAVFNILFVIGMCALFSKTVLTLTWWPLFRDCSFYSVSLMILICFFRDNLIQWWEALVLFFVYVAYVGFMKWNQQVERCVKKVIYKNKVTRVRSTDQLMPAGNAANSSETSMATQPGGSVTSRAASETRSGPPGSSSGATGNSSTNAGSTVTGAKFRHGLLQLMIHTIDPLHDDDVPGKVDEKATQLHAIASLKVLLDATKPQRGAATTSAANHVKINLKETTLASDRPNGNIDTTIDSPSLGGRRPSWIEQRVKHQTRRFSTKVNDLEEEPEALSMSWPDTGRKRITYLLVAPIVFPLWLTLPDTRTPRGKKFFPVTFIGSILWIAAYSYLMVWWANVAGDTARIPPEVMGLTFLAAGTSIPDLITSVIVARKGFGDMAVSSSVGSNIFDVTVGLPIPWLLYGIIYQQPVEVNSVGMVCSITILFMMLLFVVMSIACFRWRMNKGLGLTMFLLYFVFVAVSLMFEYNIIRCPV